MAKAVALEGRTEDRKDRAEDRKSRGELTPSPAPAWKTQPERFKNFLRDVRSEMHKVVTPTRDEVRSTTTVVIIAVFLFAAFFYVVDGIAGHLVERVLHYLSGGR